VARRRAPWTAGVPSGTYGPRVHTTVALCSGSYRLSKRTTPQGLDELFGVPMSGGRISPSEKITTEVIADAVQEARATSKRKAWRLSTRPVGVRGSSGPGCGWR
jgi:hypothetical protein